MENEKTVILSTRKVILVGVLQEMKLYVEMNFN